MAHCECIADWWWVSWSLDSGTLILIRVGQGAVWAKDIWERIEPVWLPHKVWLPNLITLKAQYLHNKLQQSKIIRLDIKSERFQHAVIFGHVNDEALTQLVEHQPKNFWCWSLMYAGVWTLAHACQSKRRPMRSCSEWTARRETNHIPSPPAQR